MGGPEQTIASVRVLGAVHAVATDGSPIDLPSASQRRLLAILALHSPRRLRSEWLADALDISPGALRTTVSRVRATVGTTVLESGSTGYALVVDVDAAQFCRVVAQAATAEDPVPALQRALALWNGPPLEEFSGEEWAGGEVARLTEIHAGAVDDLADALVEAHRHAEAVSLLEGHIASCPYRDRPRGLLIRALASAGRQAEALRAFHQYRELLMEETGTEPSPDVVRIERRVATGWNGVDSAPGARATTAFEAVNDVLELPLPVELTLHGQLVGRVAELEVLTKELALVTTTGARCVVVGGEAGIGKTTLLVGFAQSVMASGRAAVLYGRCDETGVSMQPFRTILSACVEHASVGMLTEHVARHGGELLRLCPGLALRVPTTPSPTKSDDSAERFLAFEAAVDVVRRIANARPLVMMLDDLQWAEPTALLLLRHLARGLADAPVLLVIGSREPDEHATGALRLAFADLDRGQTRRLDLAGFDASELDDLLEGAGSFAVDRGSGVVMTALQVQTAGNPLYASQLIQHWMETGFTPDSVPPSVRDVIWRRVHALGEDATEVMTTAAVLGVQFDEDVLLEMIALPQPVVLDALDVAARGGLLVDAGSIQRSYRFTHALVANALVTDLGPARRARLHGIAARALEKSLEVFPPKVVVELARHCALAGWPAEAQQWSTRAGDDARDHLAMAEAVHHYRVALDVAIALDRPVAERADLLVRLGDAQHRSGDADAFDTLQAGAGLAQECGANAVLIRAALAADSVWMRGDQRAAEYLATVEAAVVVADPADVATYARLCALLAQSLMYTPHAERRLKIAHQALALADSQDDPTLLVQVAPAVLFALWAPGSRELRSAVAARAIRAAERTGDPRLEFNAHLSAYTVAVESADPTVAARSLAKLRATEHRLDEPRLRWIVALFEAFEATMAGRLDDGEALANANLELGLQIRVPDAFTIWAGQYFVIGTFGGRHADLFPVVEQAAKEGPGLRPFQLAYGIICTAVGREEVARDILRAAMAKQFEDIALDNFWTTSVIGYAILATEIGDAEAAAYLLPMIEPFAAEIAFNGGTSQGPIAAYVGKLASLLGQYDDAEQHLLAALEIVTAFGWKYHRATTLFALAQNRFRQLGTLDGTSETWLSEASDLCRIGGFNSWLPRVEALVAIG